MRNHAKANLSALIESSDDLIWSVDLEFRLIAFNRALRENIEDNFGFKIEEGMAPQDFLPPERARLWPPLYERALSEGAYRCDYSLADGRTLALSFNPILTAGKVTGISVFGKDITERKQAEEQLRESEARFRRFFEENSSVMVLVDPESGVVVAANRAAAAYAGATPEEAKGQLTQQFILKPEEWIVENRQLILRRERTAASFPIRLASGEVRQVESYSSPFEVDGRTLIFSVVHDVTERKQMEEALSESSGFLTEAQRIGDLGCYVLDCSTGVWTSTSRLDEIFGIDENYARTVEGWEALVHPEDRERMNDYFVGEVIGQGRPFDKEYRILRPSDGAVRWVRGLGKLEFDSNGKPLKMRGIIGEITAHKEWEAQLQESEERYRSTFEQAAVGIVHASFDGMLLRGNARFAQLVGFTPQEIAGLPISQVTAPEDAAKTAAAIQRVTEGGGAETLEKRYLRKDGSSFWAETTVSLQQDSHGRPLHLIVFIADITERKWAEKQLSESEDRYRAAFEQAAVGIVHSTLEGRILHCNQRFAEIVGYPLEVIRNLSFQQITAPEDLDSSLAANRQILSGAIESASIEKQCLRKDGSRVWARVTLSPQRNGAGRVIGLIAVVEEIQARKEAEERLAAADAAIRSCEERYRTVFETTPDAVTISRMSDGAILDCNQSFLGSAGFERDEVIGRTAQELGIWVNEADRLKFIEQMGHSAKVRDVEVLSRRKNGDIFWMRLSASLIEIGGEQCRLTFAKEITEVKAAEERTATTSEALRLSEQRYRAAFQTSLDAININRLEDGEYIDCNEAFLKMTGFTREEVIGKTSLELKIWTDGRDRQAMAEMVRLHGSFRGSEVQFRKKNGETLWGEMSASQIEIDGVSCILSVTRDISHAKVTENTIRTLAYYDPLTGLPNRRLLAERLHQTLAAGGRDGRSQALLFVELDHFKTLNETLGHQTGKMLLQEIALRVTACARETDTVGRVGGDEFALILEDLSEEGEEAAAQAKAVGEKIRAAIGLPVLLEGRECITTASIGITVFGAARESAEELMQEADIALYQAKSAGRNSVRFFSPALQAAVNARATLEEDLRVAIKARQFLLYYQPQLERGKVTGAEALIRWQHPRHGMVPPDEFIPLAEETGLILPLGDWVLETACAQLAKWVSRKKTSSLTVAVNISALQFRQPGFVESVLKALERSGANPKHLKLELTESMLVENIDEVIEKMTELKAHGLGFSLDDFGTGYSSLAYLKRLPLDQLKIDRAFVRDMLVDETSGAIAHTIISLGRAMKMSVVAEGVESEEQRGFLAGLGCHAFQGFLFSPALPMEEFEALL